MNRFLLVFIPALFFTPICLNGSANFLPSTNTQGLLAHWSFDSSCDNIIYDMAGHGFNAFAFGYSVKITDGLCGKALECRGPANDSMLGIYDIQVKNSYPDFNLSAFSIETWAYSYVNMNNPGSFFNQRAIFENVSCGSGIAKGYCIKIYDDGKPLFGWGSSTNGPWELIMADSMMQPNRWYHFVATWDTTKIAFYINGKMAGQKPYHGSYVMPTTPARIGCQWLINVPDTSTGITRQFFNGKIDELKLYTYALDEQTIRSHYEDLKPPEEPPFEINLGMKTTYAQPGNTVVMPIYIANHEDYLMSACQLSINYDPEKLQLLSITKDSGIANKWELFDWSDKTPGSVAVAMAGTSTGLGYGEGELFRCIFKVNSSVLHNDTCIIKLADIVIDEQNHLIVSTSQDGRIIIDQKSILYGDVTGNDEVNIFDAQKVLSYVVGTLTLPDVSCPNFTLAVADVSGNGAITSYDAALIFQYGIGLVPSFPVEIKQSKPLAKRTSGFSGKAHLTMNLNNSTQSDVVWGLVGTNLRGFYAGEFAIKCDMAADQISKSTSTTDIRGATLSSKFDVNNKILRIAVMSNDDIDNNDPVTIVRITMPTSSQEAGTPFSIQTALINEGAIATDYVNKGLTTPVIAKYSDSAHMANVCLVNKMLRITGLGQGQATVALWDVSGRCVEKRILRNLSGGISGIGVIDLGQLPGGAYIYRIKNGSCAMTGKIILTQ